MGNTIDLRIYGNSRTTYNFSIHEDMAGANIQKTVFLLCKIQINQGITNEVVKQQYKEVTYLIKGVGYTENFWDFLKDNKLLHPYNIESGIVVAYFWDTLPYGKTHIDIKDDILKNTKDFPGIIEIPTT